MEVTIGKKKFFSLQYKVLLFSIALTLIPLILVGTISYVKTLQVARQKIYLSNLQTVSQTGKSLEYIMKSMQDISLYLYQNSDVITFLKLTGTDDPNLLLTSQIRLSNSIMYFVGTLNSINSVYLQSFNGVTFESTDAVDTLDSQMIQDALDKKGGYIWRFTQIQYSPNTRMGVFSLIRVINDPNHISQALGLVKINVDETTISKLLSGASIGSRGRYYVTDGSKVILSSDKDATGKALPDGIRTGKTRAGSQGYYPLAIGGTKYLVSYYHFDNMDLTLVNLVPYRELMSESSILSQILLGSAALSFVLCIVIAAAFSSRILRPLHQLRIVIRQVEKEDFNVHLDIRGNDEIALLESAFNKMSARLNELVNQVYAVGLRQREAELKALQAQINPHFLYNTLDTIYWMGRMENAPETSELIRALSRIFRLCLSTGNEFTSVRSEVDYLDSYILIQRKRYENRIHFNVTVKPETLACKTVKLVLQPLVENAIYHGLAGKGETGSIDVAVECREEYLAYIVADDGIGVDVGEIEHLLRSNPTQKRGLGIKNVNDRIRLCFGENYGLYFENNTPSGTRVTVLQPIIPWEEGRHDPYSDRR